MTADSSPRLGHDFIQFGNEVKIERTHVDIVHYPFTLAMATLWSKFEQLVPKLYSLAGFSYTHSEVDSFIRNSFSGGFSSFVMGAVRVLPPRHSALGVGV